MLNKQNQWILILALLITLPACKSISVPNPFGSDSHQQSRTPQNATAYLCEGNKQFYVRMQNNGHEAWLIYPTHEVSLTKTTDSKNRFTSGAITLVINGDETTLNDGEKIAYIACKPQLKK
jgi:membrane-bound inhibitor of C-type lysozyme